MSEASGAAAQSRESAHNGNGVHDPATGQFTPGHPNVSPGRPRAVIEADFARAARDAISVADFRKLIDKCLADALAGDARARSDILKLVLGDGGIPYMALAIRDLARLGTDEEVAAGAELQADQVRPIQQIN